MAISSNQIRPLVAERARRRLPRVSVVVPARNEAANLPHVLPAIPRFAREVILVDGHSSDDTIEVARQLRPDIIVVRQTGRGKGDALREGFAAATGDIIVMIDADGSTDPREIPRFVRPLLTGADFVKGSRFTAHGGSEDITWFRQLGNAGLNILVNTLFGTRYTDLCYGYNAFWRDCLDCFEVDCQGFEVETLINLRAHKAHLTIVEAPSFERSRIHGASNLNTMRDGWRVLKMIARERLNGSSVVVDARFAMARTRRLHAFAPPAAPERARVIVSDDRRVSRSQRIEPLALPAPSPVAKTSVVLAAYAEARWDDLVAAVASLREQTVQPHEIILVVDHNRPLFERARAAFGDVTTIENTQRQGLSGARNSAIAAATGELIAFLDDDAVAEPDWLERLAGICEDPQALGSGGWIQPTWRSGKPAWFPEEFHWVVGCSYRGLPLKLAATRNLIGASMCIRREVFEEIGGFRTDIGRVGANPMGCEETELCVRAQQRWPERTFLHQPRAVIHHAVPSARATWRYFRSRCFAEGRSKAQVVHSVGSRDGLSSERAYTLRTLPIGVLRGLVDAVSHRDLSGMGRAGAIIAGLMYTAAGYLTGRFALALDALRAWLTRPLAGASKMPPTAPGAQHATHTVFESAPEVALEGSLIRPLRVLLVTARYLPLMGGVETHTFEVARRLVEGGAEVTVLTTDTSGKLPRAEIVDGIQIRRVRAWPAKRDFYFAPAMYRIITRGGWDIVHCQGCHTLVAPLAMFAALRARIPYVLTFHTGGHSSPLRNRVRGIQWTLLRPLLARAQKLIGVSRFEADFFHQRLRLPVSQFAVVPNGGRLPKLADSARSEPGDKKSGPLIVSVGRLERYKGHHRVIEALPHLRRQHPDAGLLILGAGPYEAELRHLAEERGVGEAVEIRAIAPGDRGGMASTLARADLVTLLSDYEAHPIAAMEALALERKVLVAATSGLQEFADKGLARAVPLNATPEVVAAAMARQLQEPARPVAVELPTWENCVARIASIYRVALRRPACAF